MGDFDWAGTLKVAYDKAVEGKTGINVIIAGTSADGAAAGSYPLADDGNYKAWVSLVFSTA